MNKSLVVLALLAVISACKKDNETSAGSLSGKWYMHEEYASDGWDGTIASGYSKDDYYLFNTNNTVTKSTLLVNSDGSSKVIKSSFNYIMVQQDAKPSQMIMYNTERKNYYNIIKLTKDSLHFSMRDTTYIKGGIYSTHYLLKLSRK